MPVPVPNLDDRRFDDLVQEGRALIPLRAPEWTNHNTADPGITILEVFAYVTEAMLYQTNRITEHHRQEFLRMLVGLGAKHATEGGTGQRIEEAIRQFDVSDRAITCQDYVRLAEAADPDVVRAQCVAGVDLTTDVPFPQPNHVSIVIFSRSSEEKSLPSSALLQRVNKELDSRRLLATHVHVVAPRYVSVTIRLSVVAKVGTDEDVVRDEIAQAIRVFLDPVKGGPAGTGWPTGKSLYVSALLKHLHAVSGVAYVEPETIDFAGESSRLHRGPDNSVISVELRPGEVFTPEILKDTIQVSYEV